MNDQEGNREDEKAEANKRTIPSLEDTGEAATPAQRQRQTESPEAGYPAGGAAAKPYGDEVPDKEHPEDIGTDAGTRESSTEGPGTPPSNRDAG